MNWLKVEIGTPEKPEIGQIMRLCKCSRGDAFLAFFRFYRWADSMTKDGLIEYLTPEDADEHAGLSGFGKALEAVKWIRFSEDGGADIQNYDRHNGQSAKRRMADCERKRIERADKPPPPPRSK